MAAHIEPIDCNVRLELSKQLATAVSQIALLSKAGVGSFSERSEASLHLRQLRREYWKHVREHGCKDPGDRLRVIGATPASPAGAFLFW